MCGIAGLIHRDKSVNIGSELQSMLQALKHRGPDSTGYALYADNDGQNFIMRFKVGENVGEGSNAVNEEASVYDERKKIVDKNLSDLGAIIVKEERLTPYSFRYEIKYDKDLMEFSKKIESAEMTEILSIGKSLELIKDIGDAKEVCDRYNLDKITGTHAIGHARMATESAVTTMGAHPFSTGNDQFGLVVGAKYFYDFELKDESRAEDDTGYARMLSKETLDIAGADIELVNAYIYGSFDPGLPLKLKRLINSIPRGLGIVGGLSNPGLLHAQQNIQSQQKN